MADKKETFPPRVVYYYAPAESTSASCPECDNLPRCPCCGSTAYFDGECVYCEDDDQDQVRIAEVWASP